MRSGSEKSSFSPTILRRSLPLDRFWPMASSSSGQPRYSREYEDAEDREIERLWKRAHDREAQLQRQSSLVPPTVDQEQQELDVQQLLSFQEEANLIDQQEDQGQPRRQQTAAQAAAAADTVVAAAANQMADLPTGRRIRQSEPEEGREERHRGASVTQQARNNLTMLEGAPAPYNRDWDRILNHEVVKKYIDPRQCDPPGPYYKEFVNPAPVSIPMMKSFMAEMGFRIVTLSSYIAADKKAHESDPKLYMSLRISEISITRFQHMVGKQAHQAVIFQVPRSCGGPFVGHVTIGRFCVGGFS